MSTNSDTDSREIGIVKEPTAEGVESRQVDAVDGQIPDTTGASEESDKHSEQLKSGSDDIDETDEEKEPDEEGWSSDREPERPGQIPRGKIKFPVSNPKPRPKQTQEELKEDDEDWDSDTVPVRPEQRTRGPSKPSKPLPNSTVDLKK